jgi:hypothetical protein
LQRTIQTEFSGSTLLCIAHRLNTVGEYLFPSSFLSRRASADCPVSLL